MTSKVDPRRAYVSLKIAIDGLYSCTNRSVFNHFQGMYLILHHLKVVGLYNAPPPSPATKELPRSGVTRRHSGHLDQSEAYDASPSQMAVSL